MSTDVILVAVGLFAILGAVYELRKQRLLRRQGVRVMGSVVRRERRSTDASSAPSWYPIVAFTDADGVVRECQHFGGMRKTDSWPLGREVPVVYLPQSPDRARIDMRSQRLGPFLPLVVVPVVFLVVTIVVMVKR